MESHARVGQSHARRRTAALRPARAPAPRRIDVPGVADGDRARRVELGFPLPPLLRQIYRVANGGVRPGFGLLRIGEGHDPLAAVYRSFAESSLAPRPGEPGFDQYPWPDRLLPICDWGCAIWSCLDCRTDDGAIVTASNGDAFANTGHTLESWLSAWLAGVELFEEMFEPGPTRAGITPFTKQPIVIKGRGEPRGTRWP